jgi:hypothetical protein
VFVYFPAVTYVLLHEFQFCFLGFRFPMIYKDFQGRKIFFIRVRRHSLCSSVIRVYPLSSYLVLCILSICTYRTLDPALSVDKLVYQDIFERLVILVRCHLYQCHRKFSSLVYFSNEVLLCAGYALFQALVQYRYFLKSYWD